MKMEKILQSIVLITACIASCGGVEQVLLESDPDTSVPVCPGVPLNFTCNATELSSLSWYRDGIPSFFTIDILGGTTGTPPDGLQVVVDSVQRTGSLADFISTLIVDNATLVGGSEICCGLLGLFDDCINVTLKTISSPTITSISEETVKSVTITVEGSECFMNYIIQYGNETVSTSTGGNLSVVIEDTVFCSVVPVTFNVTAVLGDGSMMSGSESDFTVTGETLSTITGVNVTGPNITWMEPDPSCDCIERYDIESNGAVVGSSPCGNPQYECEECRCEELSLTVTPVLRNGIRVESSRSDPVTVGEDFPKPNFTNTFICSEAAEVIMFLQSNTLSEYSDGTIEVTFSRDGVIMNTSVMGPSVTEICCELDYREFNGDEVVFNITFRGGGVCEKSDFFTQTILNVINSTEPVSRSPKEAQERLMLNDCTNSTSICPSHLMGEMKINYTYVETDTDYDPVTEQITFPEDITALLSLTALDPETNYSLTVEVVIVEGGMIGVECNDTLKTTTDEADSSERTGLIIGDALLALIYIIAVVVAVVLILLTWWKYRTRDCSLNLDTLLKELKEVEGDWKQLGECLGVSPSQLDEIAKQCSTAAECMVEMLDVWIRNHVGHPTWKEVIVGLGKLNRYHLAESLKHRYTTVSLRWWQLVILVCGAVLLVVSIILLILVIVELSEDIDTEVEDGGTIGLVAASYIISAVTAVLWIVLIFLAPKWITGHSLCERSVDEPDSGEKPRKKSKRKSKTAPEEIPMTGEHYGKLQRPGMVSPTELLEEPSQYATLDMGEADVTTGQQEYAVARHGPKPQGVANINDPNYGHLNEGEAAQPEYDVAQHGRPKPRKGGPEVPGRGAESGYGRLDQATRMKEYEEVSQAPRYKPRDSGRRQ